MLCRLGAHCQRDNGSLLDKSSGGGIRFDIVSVGSHLKFKCNENSQGRRELSRR